MVKWARLTARGVFSGLTPTVFGRGRALRPSATRLIDSWSMTTGVNAHDMGRRVGTDRGSVQLLRPGATGVRVHRIDGTPQKTEDRSQRRTGVAVSPVTRFAHEANLWGSLPLPSNPDIAETAVEQT